MREGAFARRAAPIDAAPLPPSAHARARARFAERAYAMAPCLRSPFVSPLPPRKRSYTRTPAMPALFFIRLLFFRCRIMSMRYYNEEEVKSRCARSDGMRTVTVPT